MLDWWNKMQVEMSTWEYAGAPEILETQGLGPCMGIAIYDPQTKSGYLAHLVSPISTTHWQELMGDVSSSFPNLSELEVTLAGACIEDETDIGNREYVFDDLTERGFRKIREAFNDNINGCVDLVLYLSSGRIEIETEEIDLF